MKNYYVGTAAEDGSNGPNRGWIVGSFMDDAIRKTDDVEIKYWTFPIGETSHDTKVSTVIEITLILSGVVRGEIDGEPVVMRAGQYMVIPAGIENNVPMEVLQPASGITIKAPSDVSGKKVVKED